MRGLGWSDDANPGLAVLAVKQAVLAVKQPVENRRTDSFVLFVSLWRCIAALKKHSLSTICYLFFGAFSGKAGVSSTA